MNSRQLRKTKPEEGQLTNIKRNPIYLVLDNVIDTYNIGSLFRLGDALAVSKIYICGDTEYPPSSRIHKAAVGTEEWVPWEKTDNTKDTIKKLKSEGIQIIAIEQSDKSIPYTLLAKKLNFPCAIVVGNETNGIEEKVLDLADIIVELPMFGINKSFNVWGSAAVIGYLIVQMIIWPSSILKAKKNRP